MQPIVGLCLSGGGVRGTAHIGVIKALEENGITAEYISGSSAGAIVGGMYAAGVSVEKQFEAVSSATLSKTYKLGLPTQGLTDLSYLKKHLSQYIKNKEFKELPKVLFVAVSNLETGKLEIISEGPVLDAIQASSSVPLIFKPTEIDGKLYADGGLMSNLPVQPLIPYVDKIIAVNVMPIVEEKRESFQSYFGIANRVAQMGLYANAKPNYDLCDIVIEPLEMAKFHIFNFKGFEEMLEIGYKAAMEKMDEIKKLVSVDI